MASFSESEAVAKDFQEALEDISSNARYEIANLTVIARENTEHALPISGALQDHIKRAAPHKKLPALYVMDSIVKNVGTPYTLFFGRKLYQTFMEAYASVDMPTRRKMDEMLKTWKEPIPGSMDTRPVFPHDVVRPIENALLKARTNALQAQQGRVQHNMPGRRPGQPGPNYRDTPTPPGAHPGQAHAFQSQAPPHGGAPYGFPTQQMHGQYPPPHHSQPPSSHSTPQPPAMAASAFPPPRPAGYGMMPQPGINIDALNDDIQRLIAASEAQLAQAPHDPSVNTRLKALRDLQTILQTQNLPQDQVVLIKKQIDDLAVTIRPPSAQIPTPTPPPQPQHVAVAPPPSTAAAPKVSLDSLLGQGTLAAIMARTSGTPQASTPPLPAALASAIRPPPPPAHASGSVPAPAASASNDPLALMNALRKAGILPGSGPTPPAGSTPSTIPPSLPPMPGLPFPLPVLGQTQAPQNFGPPTLENFAKTMALNTASLKQYRPYLIPFFFDAQGPQCSQCGRRFSADAEGKRKKTAHMDWHFKVNRRIIETEKQGQHRSWYVDKDDWINSREAIDEDRIPENSDTSTSTKNTASKTPQLEYIPVPDDPVLANSVCPICQEKFETRWLDDAQEFVWPDAMKLNNRVYHASCYKESTQGEVPPPVYARNTPEPVLGKRKAEDELASLRAKMKMEAA